MSHNPHGWCGGMRPLKNKYEKKTNIIVQTEKEKEKNKRRNRIRNKIASKSRQRNRKN